MTATETTTTTLLELALEAHDNGYCVVPPRQNGTKAPMGYWTKYQTSRPSREQVELWYSTPTRTGIGFVGGAVSGGLELFEFEGRAVDAGIFDRFIEDAADDPVLDELVNRIIGGWRETSPSGGLHTYYRCSETGCVKLAKRPSEQAGEPAKDLIETKGEGGYMIVAPSGGQIHPTGRSWELGGGGPSTVATITPAERELLLDHARRYDERPQSNETTEPPQHPDLGDFAEVAVRRPSGPSWVSAVVEDYNSRTNWAQVLAGTMEHLYDRKGIGYWHYVGADNEVSATTNAKGTDTLIVFSGTAEGGGWQIHTPGSGRRAPSYDRFSAHVQITRGNNNKDSRVEVARALRAEGYGPPEGQVGARSVDPETGEITGPETAPAPDARLPEDFWNARPALAHIRQAAHADAVPADAVLAAVLARIAAATPPTLVGPAPVGSPAALNVGFVLLGPPGTGKSTSNDTAERAVPLDGLEVGPEGLTVLSLGSGEGIAESYMGEGEEVDQDGKKRRVRRQVRSSVLFVADEGQHIADVGGRSGSTLLSNLRTALTGGALGQANASADRQRQLPKGAYRFALVAGLQPEHAVALVDDAAGGTPARFVWLAATDPTIPDEGPPWPGPLRWRPPLHKAEPMDLDAAVAAEIRGRSLARQRGQLVVDALDAHRDLNRLKVGALLAILEGRTAVTDDDWHLAGIVMTTSDRVRAGIIAADQARRRLAEHQATERHVRRAGALEESTERRALDRMARAIGRHVHAGKCAGGCGRSCLTRATAGRDRQAVGIDEALAEACHRGFVTADGDTYCPGDTRPA